MNEQQFAYKIRHYLNLGGNRVSPKVVDRLHAARQQALARQRVASIALSVPGVGRITADLLLPRVRMLATLVALALGVAAVSYWSSLQKAAEIEEVDSALLSDELPINAYLDRGFDAWLKHTSPQQ